MNIKEKMVFVDAEKQTGGIKQGRWVKRYNILFDTAEEAQEIIELLEFLKARSREPTLLIEEKAIVQRETAPTAPEGG